MLHLKIFVVALHRCKALELTYDIRAFAGSKEFLRQIRMVNFTSLYIGL